MFNAGDLVASIRMEGLPQFEQDNRRAEQMFKRTGDAGREAGERARAALQTAAGAVTAITATGAALVRNLVSTGAAYNTLQQTSRAALTTLLGGTKQAADQMARLDDFARNSPFSKAIFISAQQQLLGFGVEAKKVIPILGAVQDAVAATGGSSNEIASVVEVLASIKSQGKITGEELMQLGGRGIDAAGLIGQSLGKSGAEIRKSITDGALDATTALDALVAGMTAKYGGAAAEVKKTWTGATDRIRAANREIGAALAEPFISQQGGGMAITWGNQVADVLRAILVHANPVVTMLTGRMMPGFAALTTALDEARVVIKSWDSSKIEGFLDQASNWTASIAGLAGAVVALTGGLLGWVPVVGPVVASLNPFAAALAAIALTSPEVRAALGDLFGAFEPLIPVGKQLLTLINEGLNQGLPIAAALIGAVADAAVPLLDVISKIPAPLLLGVAAFFAFDKAAGALSPVIGKAVDAGGKFLLFLRNLRETAQVQSALAAMEGNTSRFAGAMGTASKAAQGLAGGLKAAFIANAPALAILGVVAVASALTAAFAAQAEHAAKLKEQVKEYRDTLVETTGAITEATDAQIEKNLVDSGAIEAGEKLGLSKATLIAAVKGEKDALDAVRDTYTRNAGVVVRDGITQSQKYAAEAGLVNATILDQKRLLAEAAEATRRDAEERRRAAAAMTDMERSNARMNTALEIARDVTKEATERLSALKQALDELNGGAKSAAEVEKELNDQTRALADAFNVTDENGKKIGETLVDAAGKIDTSTAAGSRLFDEVKRLNDQMLDAILIEDEAAKKRGESGVSADKAREIFNRYAGTLRDVASEAGLSAGEIDGLIGQMLDTPEVVAFALDDSGTVDAARLRLLALADQITSTPNGTIDLDSSQIEGIQADLRDMGFKIENLPDGKVRVTASGVQSVEDALNNLTRTREARIVANVVGTRQSAPVETGGVFQRGVKAFATGGMPFPSGIYAGRPEAIHKFAEGHLPWEAYISPHPAYRGRNKNIVKEVARRLGGHAEFEAGGIAAYASGGIARGWRVTQDERDWFREFLEQWNRDSARGQRGDGLQLVDRLLAISEQVQGGAHTRLRKTALTSEKAFVKLEKQADQAATVLERAKDKLDDLRGAAASMASTVAGAVRRFFSVGDLAETSKRVTSTRQIDGIDVTTTRDVQQPVTAANIAASMKSSAARIKGFADKLARLAKKGLPPALLAEIAALGVEGGEPVVDALLTATSAEVKQISDSYKAIDRYSSAAGQTVSDANYKALVTAAEKQLAAADRNADKIAAAIKRETDRIVYVLADSLRAGSTAPIKRAHGGPIVGPGTGLSDSILMYGSNGEHMITAREVVGAGGHAAVERQRAAWRRGIPGFATGGPVLRVPAQEGVSVHPGLDRALVAELAALMAQQRPIDLEVTYVNPIVRDLESDAQDAAEIIAAGLGGADV